MQNNAVQSRYYSGQGILLIAPKDPVSGLPMGFRNVGNVPNLTISPKTSTIDHKESSTGARGIDKRLTTEIACDVSATLESVDAKNLALAMRGTGTEVAAGTVSAEEITAYLGATCGLSRLDVSTVVVKGTGAKSAITYELDKNYTVNEEVGSINFLSTDDQTDAGAAANIAEGDVVSVAFAYGAQTIVDALDQPSLDYVLRFEGLNTADTNKPVVVVVFKFSPNPLKELALITDKLGDFVLEGPAMADLTRKTGSKYFREILGA